MSETETIKPNPAVILPNAHDDETDPSRMQVPDLWHVAMRAEGTDREQILFTWHLCHRLLRHAKEMKAGHRFDS